MRPLRRYQDGRVFEPTTLAAKRGPCDRSATVTHRARVAAKVACVRGLVRTHPHWARQRSRPGTAEKTDLAAAAQEQGRDSGKMSRPSPIPSCFRVMEESAWVNERKIS